MTAPRFTVIEGGGSPLDTFPLDKALVGIEKTRPLNLRIRKRLMLDALQKAGIAIHRGDFERADAILEQTRVSIRNTIKRMK